MGVTFEKQAIIDDLVKILEDLSGGWESGFESSIGPETFLGADLDFKSITLVQFIVEIQKRYDRQDLPFQELFMPGGRVMSDMRVADVGDFLFKHLNDR